MADQNPAPLSDDERAELQRLRAEVDRLEHEVEPAPVHKRPGRWRTLVATLLIIFGALFVPASVLAMFTHSEITDTARYVDTIAPLANNAAIQDSVANQITEQIFKYVDVQSLTTQAFSLLGSKGILPDALVTQLQSLAGPVSKGIENFIRDQVNNIVHSGVFAEAWIAANKVAHQGLITALQGKPDGSVSIENGTVSVNLAALISTVKTSLTDRGFGFASKIPEVNASFTILQSQDLATAQKLYKFFTPLAYLMPILAVLFLGLGIYLAKNHRRAVIGAGIAVFVAAGVTALAVAGGRTAYLNAVPSTVMSHDAAAVIFDTIFRYLKQGVRNAAMLGAVVAVGAFLVGPASGCVAIRRWCVKGIASMRNGVERLGLHLGVVSDWLAPNVRIFRILTVVGGAIAFVLWKYRTPTDILWIVFWMLVALAIIQFLATPAPKSPTSDDSVVPVAA